MLKQVRLRHFSSCFQCQMADRGGAHGFPPPSTRPTGRSWEVFQAHSTRWALRAKNELLRRNPRSSQTLTNWLLPKRSTYLYHISTRWFRQSLWEHTRGFSFTGRDKQLGQNHPDTVLALHHLAAFTQDAVQVQVVTGSHTEAVICRCLACNSSDWSHTE